MSQLDGKQVRAATVGSVQLDPSVFGSCFNAIESNETATIPSGKTMIFIQDLTVRGRIVFNSTSRLVGIK